MKCPKCEHEMEVVAFKDVEVDRCTLCKGLFHNHVSISVQLFQVDVGYEKIKPSNH